MTTALAITGLGLVLPCGDGVERAQTSLASGQPCFAPLPEGLGAMGNMGNMGNMGSMGTPSRGASCTAFQPAGIIPPIQLRRLDRPARFAWVAAHQAFQDAGLDPKALGEAVAVCVGTLTGGSEASEAFMRPYLQRGPEGASPLLFPNSVANATSGHLALAFGLKGPSATFVDRENAAFAALEQASRWLRAGLAEVALVLGTDGLFPLLSDICGAAGMLTHAGLPTAGSGRGFLPGEGAQAFLLEPLERAQARGATPRAVLRQLTVRSAASSDSAARAAALARAVDLLALGANRPDRWIGGSNGSNRLDRLEQALHRAHPTWPAALHPKTLWGEFGGSGGQLLAAALLAPARSVLITAPASSGAQFAALLEGVSLDRP